MSTYFWAVVQLTIASAKTKTKLPQVVRSAIDLFVEKGVDGTTIREIAERAGVSEGALYRHYASKEELACSIFLTHLQQLTGELAVAIEGASDYRRRSARSSRPVSRRTRTTPGSSPT